jgi:hypothetical protein
MNYGNKKKAKAKITNKFDFIAARNANGETNLTTKIEVLNADGRAIVSSPVSPLAMKAVADLARIPLMASILLGAITLGGYLLRVTVDD